MTKVLGKAFGILEEVAQSSPRPVALAELTQRLKINKATCSRLALELVESGYLEQVSRMAGFTTGPRAWSFGRRAVYAEELRNAAEGPARACAEKLGESALVAILRNGLRYLVVRYNFNKAVVVKLDNIVYTDTFHTATGLVLLAYGAPEDFDLALAHRTPEQSLAWDKAGGDKRKDAILAKIRKDGYFIRDAPESSLSALGFPIFKDGRFIAAFGVSAPYETYAIPGRRKEIMAMAAATAKAITERLSSANAF